MIMTHTDEKFDIKRPTGVAKDADMSVMQR
jgi:hypothetical protein